MVPRVGLRRLEGDLENIHLLLSNKEKKKFSLVFREVIYRKRRLTDIMRGDSTFINNIYVISCFVHRILAKYMKR